MTRLVSLATAIFFAVSLPAAAAQAGNPNTGTSQPDGTTGGTHAPTHHGTGKHHHKTAKHGGTTAQKNKKHTRTHSGKPSGNS
jgi:hypothetical protein